MEIIAKTDNGFIISATNNEVNEILSAIMGKRPDKIEIGQKIPAIDYASTIRRVSSLTGNSTYINMLDYIRRFNEIVDGVKNAVESAQNLKE